MLYKIYWFDASIINVVQPSVCKQFLKHQYVRNQYAHEKLLEGVILGEFPLFWFEEVYSKVVPLEMFQLKNYIPEKKGSLDIRAECNSASR